MSRIDDPWGGADNGGSSFESKVSGIFKGGVNFPGRKNFFILPVLVILIVWLADGFYVVHPREIGVELRFGKYTVSTAPGLHYHMPSPIERVKKVNVTVVNREEIGYRSSVSGDDGDSYVFESLMLTGDENIIDINFEVQWRIKDAVSYLFNVREEVRGMTVKDVAESVMREIVGRSDITYLIEGVGRAAIAHEAQDIIQETVDEYGLGVVVLSVQMKKVDPPTKVIAAFRDVQTARADKERTVNQAYAYRNEILPAARADANRALRTAEAYYEQVVNKAVGETKKFDALYNEYVDNRFLMKRRLYYDAMQHVMHGADKIILSPNGSGALPILPMNDWLRFNNLSRLSKHE